MKDLHAFMFLIGITGLLSLPMPDYAASQATGIDYTFWKFVLAAIGSLYTVWKYTRS